MRGTCRNDDFSALKDKYLLISLAFNAVAIPLLRTVVEATYWVKHNPLDLGFSRLEHWRRIWTPPMLDMLTVLSPVLGALLYPEGYQMPAKEGP